MTIEILFTNVLDKSKIYREQDITIRDFSTNTGSQTTVPCSEYIGKEYCQNALERISENISEIMHYEYKGAMERIANEVFVLRSDKHLYTISCTIDTYASEKTRMLVSIVSELNPTTEQDASFSEYDQTLEKIKLYVKTVFRADWENCIWMKDEQSEVLCSNLYPHIFRAENRTRAFANKVLIWNLGNNWLNSPGLEKYAESHKKLSEDFRMHEPAFVDVDDVCISTTLETLFEIIQKGIIYESPFALSQNQYNDLIALISRADKKENIANWIQKKRNVKKNIWKDIFEPYFLDTSNYQQIITDFILNRNHIAHNKPTTWCAYKTMEKSFLDFDKMILKANEKFENSVPSEEFYLTIDIQNEEARDAEEYERTYLRDRIFGETGINILWHDEIFDLFKEKANTLYQTFHDLYYWDNRLTISSEIELHDNDTWQTLFRIHCNACPECYIDVQAQMSIDDEMDGDSSLSYKYVLYGRNNEVKDSITDNFPMILYHNGNGYEDSLECKIELYSESYLDESEIDLFLEELASAIEEINPYIAIKSSLEERAIKEGDRQPVADFPCSECENNGISIRDDFYPFGHCCYCGADNNISICIGCESPFEKDGDDELCNNCREKIKKE